MPTTTRAAGGVAQPPTDGGLGAAVPELSTPGHTPAETPSGTSQHSGGRPSPNGGSGEREMNMGYRSPGHQPHFSPLQLFDDPDRPTADTITGRALKSRNRIFTIIDSCNHELVRYFKLGLALLVHSTSVTEIISVQTPYRYRSRQSTLHRPRFFVFRTLVLRY